jgi:glucose/arabinose dehydrogenase
LQTVVTGISRLVYAAQPPGSSDWWLLRQTGQVLIRSGDQTSMLLDLKDLFLSGSATDIGDNEERGLLGLAFAPDFATSGTFYLKLTPIVGADASRDQLHQYKKMGATAMLTATVLNFPASAGNHNGGQILFGPDGMLYVAAGDGGGGCNDGSMTGFPQLISNSPNSWFGKILRLDPSNAAGNYAAAGNPFPESPLVWHLGLRNPFRFSFDSMSGDMFIGDVGQDSYEEVSYAKAGAKALNFGWATYEGKISTCGTRPLRAGDTATDPIFIADRRKNGCQGMYCDWVSVIGGVVYRGNALPQLRGTYVFGDYQGVRMAALRQCSGGTSPVVPIRKNADPNSPNAASFGANDFGALVAIVEDNAKELYFVVNRNSLRKVVAAP